MFIKNFSIIYLKILLYFFRKSFYHSLINGASTRQDNI